MFRSVPAGRSSTGNIGCAGQYHMSRHYRMLQFVSIISWISAGAWSDKSDVFSYGVILLGLIAKRVFDLEKAKDLGELNYVHIWAWMEYGKPSKKPRSKYFFGTEKPRSEFCFGTDAGKPQSKWGMFKKQKESQSNKSLVDKSLESDEYFDAGDGVEITKLAMRCVDYNPEKRPMMKEVVRCLRELNVVKKSSRVVVPKMSVGSSGGDGILLHE